MSRKCNSSAATYIIDTINTSQNSIIADKLKVVEETEGRKIDYKNCVVLHCGKCNTVWGDSLGICGEDTGMGSIICLKVTVDVVVKDELELSLVGHLASCTYKALHCSGCQRFVGVVLQSTPLHLSSLRSLFLLQKENMNCYILKNSTMVKASTVNFECRPMGKRISELKQELDAQLKQLFRLNELLGELSSSKVE